MKRWMILLFTLMLMLSMTACSGGGGTSGSEDETAQSGEMQGYAGGDGASLADVNEKNYTAAAEELFGMDLAAPDGWEVQEAVSYNGVNNLTVKFATPDDIDGRAVSKGYFDQALAVAENGVYAQNIDLDSMTVSKGDAYTDFETYFSANGTQIENFYSSMWLYDFGGKSIQFSVSLDTGYAEITLTLLS